MVIFRCHVSFRVKKPCLEKIPILTNMFQHETTTIHKVLVVLVTSPLGSTIGVWSIWEKSQQTKFYIHIYVYIDVIIYVLGM